MDPLYLLKWKVSGLRLDVEAQVKRNTWLAWGVSPKGLMVTCLHAHSLPRAQGRPQRDVAHWPVVNIVTPSALTLRQVGADVVIAAPGSGGSVAKYKLSGKSMGDVQPSALTTLTSASVAQANGVTTMKFSKLLAGDRVAQ